MYILAGNVELRPGVEGDVMTDVSMAETETNVCDQTANVYDQTDLSNNINDNNYYL